MILRSIIRSGLVQLFVLTGFAATSLALVSAQDADISVDPVIHQFPATVLNTDSVVKVFNVTNHNATGVMTIGSLSLGGPHADQYVKVSDTCSGATLAALNGTCSVSVKYHPTRSGITSATVLIASSDVETPILTAFVTTNEATTDQAIRRMPSVLEAVDVPVFVKSNTSTTVTWSLLGYDTSYQTNMVIFDCSGIINGSCGDSYGSANRVYDSGSLTPIGNQGGDWSFNGVSSRKYNFSHTFTAPTVSVDTDFVIRFYSKSQVDTDAGKEGLSLLIPGNLPGVSYYDTSGRRIVKQIIP
jgi:hypothetical protein